MHSVVTIVNNAVSKFAGSKSVDHKHSHQKKKKVIMWNDGCVN